MEFIFNQAEIDAGVRVMDAVTKFAYNADHDEFAQRVYGKEPNSYTLEKFKAMQSGLTHYFGSLDTAHREALVTAALIRQASQG